MQFYRSLLHIKWLIPLLFLWVAKIPAQVRTEQEFNLAKMLETAGNYEAALQFYLRAYKKGNTSYQTMSGIKKCYVSMGKFDELITFFEDFLQKHPGQIYYKVDLGSAYYWNNQKDKAFAIWRRVLKDNKQNVAVYRRVGAAMIDFRLYDDAITVYEQAMRNIKKQELLYRDIAQLYKARLEYRRAADSFLKYYLYYPKQISYIRSQFISMARDTTATRHIIHSLLAFMDDRPNDYALNEMLGEMYIRIKAYDRAFDIYEKLRKEKEKKSYLQHFAMEAEANGAYAYSVKAYRRLAETATEEIKRQNWSVLLARNLYRLSKQSTKEKAVPYLSEAIELLKRTESKPYSEMVRRRALELHAFILQNEYLDFDGAIALYKKILKKDGKAYKGENDRIRLQLAEIYIRKNDLSSARKIYRAVKDKNHERTARYQLAEICYYQAKFNCAQKEFNKLLTTLSPKDTLTNNVLDRVVFLEQFMTDSAALAEYSRAELLQRQRNFVQAAELFTALAGKPGLLRRKAGLEAARIYMRIGKTKQAEQVLTALLDAGLRQDELDEVYFLLAQVKDKENDVKAALDHYRKVFVDFPNSLYSEEARDRARELSVQINKN